MYCKIPDIFRQWRNMVGSILFVLQNAWHFCMMVGSILFVLQNSWHFQVMEKYVMIYFICTNIQSQLIIFGLFWEFFGNSLEHVGLGVLYMLRITLEFFTWWVMTQIMDIRRYLGLRGDRQDKKTITRSASWRFLALKNTFGYNFSAKIS